MTCLDHFMYLAVTTALALGSEAFDKPQTQQGNTDDHVQVVVNEHLFAAGNDSTGTAAITFTSRLDPSTPTINQFINYSFPHSCSSHPTRCSTLTYLSYRDNGTNNTRLIFYVPLTGVDSASLGLMECWHDGETILPHMTVRNISDRRIGQCDPVSVVRVPKIGVYMICASGSHSLVLCEVRNRRNVSSAWLSCTEPHSLSQLLNNSLLLSNFVVYISRPFDLYFVYNSFLYRMTHDGVIEHIALLQTFYCRYVHLAPVNTSFLIGHCYEQDQVEAFYFNLDRHHYIPVSREDATIAHYHCPDPQQLVTISVFSQLPTARASYRDRGVDKGRFNLNASQVIFAECFQSRNQTHFIYQDSGLGVFIKPNISIDLRSRLLRVSDLRCHQDQTCKQPLIFSDRYLALMYNMDDSCHQRTTVFDLYRNLKRTLTLVTNSTTQIAFFSEFTNLVKSPVSIENDDEDEDPNNKRKKLPSPKTIGMATGVPIFVLILLGVSSVAVVFLIRVWHCKRGEARRCSRPYAPVAGNDSEEAVKLKDIKRAHDKANEPQVTHPLIDKEASSSPTPPPPEEAIIDAQKTLETVDPPEPCMVANPETLPSHSSEGNISQGVNISSEELASADLPRRRSQYSIKGASHNSIPAALECTQPSFPMYMAGCGPVGLQHMNPTTPNSWGSPLKNAHSHGMPLLECYEPPTTANSISTAYATQDSGLHDSTGSYTIRERPLSLLRQSSLPNPSRPRTLVPQAQQLRSRQSPHLQHTNYNNTNAMATGTTTHHVASEMTPDNDLEYQRQLRQQQQWLCQGQPTTTRMNSSDSTNSTLSRTSTTSIHMPPVDVTHGFPNPTFADNTCYIHTSHNTVAQHQSTIAPTNAATNHHGQNFQRLDSRESAHSVISLTPESKPESGHQTGSMLVTGTSN